MKAWLEVSSQEILWALGWALIVLVLSSVPYLLGWYFSTPEMHFGGFVYNVEDCNSYIAKMRQGARGEWLFHIVYTSEEHQGGLLFLFHLALGHLASWVGLSLVLVYHLARLAFGLALLITTYIFISFFTRFLALRRLAFLLTCFSGGLAWVLVLAGQPEFLGSLPIDFLLPEAFTFLIIYAFPHIALARTLMLVSFMFFILAGERKRYSLAAISGAMLFLVGVIVPFYVFVAYVVAGSYIGGLFLKRRRFPWDEVWAAVIMAAFPIPIVLYNHYIFTTNPVFRAWSEQNLVLSPHPLHYFLGYAIVCPLAVLGGMYMLPRERNSRLIFLAAWAIVLPPLLYAPFNLQRRLIEGFQLPLCLLASFGMARYILPAVGGSKLVRFLERFRRYNRRRFRAFAAFTIILATVPSNALLIAEASLQVARPAPPIFHRWTEVEAMDWLAANTAPNDTVLASFETGNYLPTRAGNRVFAGHGSETIKVEEKKALVRLFFQVETSDDFRRDILTKYKIAYIFYGPKEKALGDFSPQKSSYLQLVYRNTEVEIYRVGNGE